jgi:hypothetical protein
MRRLGYETYTAWHIALKVKLNEIMPRYNKLFDSLEDWNLFNDGETIERTTDTTSSDTTNATNEININSNATNISDRRYSDTPQNQLEDIQNGEYVTEYNYDNDNNTSESSTNGKNDSKSDGTRNEIEKISRSPYDKISIYKEYMESLSSIYSMIFKDLDCLFYQLV